MKKLTLKEGVHAETEIDLDPVDLQDLELVVAVCHEQGYEIDRLTAYNAWNAYSESRCAGWIFIPKDREYLVKCILDYTVVA